MIVQTRQHWLARAFDILITLFAWYVFLWLLADGFGQIFTKSTRVTSATLPPQLMLTIRDLLTYILVALAITLILVLWAKYNQVRAGRYRRRARIPDMSDSRLSASFGVHPSVLHAIQIESRLVFYHDHDGHLEHAYLPDLNDTIEVRQPLPPRGQSVGQ